MWSPNLRRALGTYDGGEGDPTLMNYENVN